MSDTLAELKKLFEEARQLVEKAEKEAHTPFHVAQVGYEQACKEAIPTLERTLRYCRHGNPHFIRHMQEMKEILLRHGYQAAEWEA